jgi:hypothetical protein
VPVLDRIIAAVAAGAPEDLLGLIEFESLGCVTLEQVGSPPLCRTGEAPGTPADAFPIGRCEARLLRREETAQELAGLVQSAEAVYTAYRAQADAQGHEQFSIVFALKGTNKSQGFSVNVTEASITSVGGPCGRLRPESFETVAQEFFIRPS